MGITSQKETCVITIDIGIAYNFQKCFQFIGSDESITVEAVNDAIRSASRSRPELIQVSEDPIVSSDVIGQSCTVLFDAPGTIKAGSRMIKLLGWYENLGHAARLLDVARLYTEMEAAGV